MNNAEIKQRICKRIDCDKDFASELGDALERGAWDIITRLISQAVGYAIEKAGELIAWLKRELF